MQYNISFLITFVVKPSNTKGLQRPWRQFSTKASDEAELKIAVHYESVTTPAMAFVAKVAEEKKEVALKIL